MEGLGRNSFTNEIKYFKFVPVLYCLCFKSKKLYSNSNWTLEFAREGGGRVGRTSFTNKIKYFKFVPVLYCFCIVFASRGDVCRLI